MPPGDSPVDHHVGSMPLGIRWVRSPGSSKPSMTSLTMNLELATTSSASWASHDSTAWIVLGWPGGTRPPCWPRSVPWNVAISLASYSVASVSAAQATCQSWAWTTSRRPVAEAGRAAARGGGWPRPTRATRSSSGSHGRSVRARRTRTSPTRLSAGAPGCDSVSSTTSWPARASAWLSPSTWAATPPTDRGGNSQVSIRTRIRRTLPAVLSAPDRPSSSALSADPAVSCGLEGTATWETGTGIGIPPRAHSGPTWTAPTIDPTCDRW